MISIIGGLWEFPNWVMSNASTKNEVGWLNANNVAI
jgi:hypothetical protein